MIFSSDKRKIAIIGCGAVGMSYAFALVNQGLCNEIVLIDIDKKKAWGEASDLNHTLAFAAKKMTIYQGEYNDCVDADIAVICAGVPQEVSESRIDLLQRNTNVFSEIVPRIVDSGFGGIFLVASNPVDIMTKVTLELSGFAPHKVIGTGTILDTARLRYQLGNYFGVDPRNVHAYVMGEHGDSEFVPWSQAFVGTKPVLKIVEEGKGKYYHEDLHRIGDEVRTAAYKIIEAKGTTNYGIAMAMSRITKAIYDDENSILTVSVFLEGDFGEDDVYIGAPAIINRDGINGKVRVVMTDEEKCKFKESCQFLRETYAKLNFEALEKI